MHLFSPEGKVFQIFTGIFDIVFLNILFIISCIPVFTIGTAISSLYKVAKNIAEERGASISQMYWEAFKSNFKKSVLAWLLDLLIIVLLVFDIWYWLNFGQGLVKQAALIVSVVILYLVLMAGQWKYPIISMFENDVKATNGNSFFFAIRYLIPSFIMVSVTAFWIFITTYFEILWVLTILFGFSLPAFLKQFYIFKKLKVYAEPPKEDPRNESDRIFSDKQINSSDEF